MIYLLFMPSTTFQKDIYGHILQNCTLKEVWQRLKDVAEIEGRLRQVDNFNRVSSCTLKWSKQGKFWNKNINLNASVACF